MWEQNIEPFNDTLMIVILMPTVGKICM